MCFTNWCHTFRAYNRSSLLLWVWYKPLKEKQLFQLEISESVRTIFFTRKCPPVDFQVQLYAIIQQTFKDDTGRKGDFKGLIFFFLFFFFKNI